MHPFEYVPQHERVIYKNPPIIERVMSFVANVPPEAFFGKFDAWKTQVEESFPEYDPLQQWLLNVDQKDGVPLLETARPEVHLEHRFWRLNAQKQRTCSMRLLPNRFTINLHREGSDCRQYEDLRREVAEWLPRWAEHFEVTEFLSVQLDYVNLLGEATTPTFVKEGKLHIGNMLTMFQGVPGRFISLVPPYNCHASLLFYSDSACQYVGFVRVSDVEGGPGKPLVRLDLQLRFVALTDPFNLHTALTEADLLHTMLVDQFEFLFTPEAKKSFGKE